MPENSNLELLDNLEKSKSKYAFQQRKITRWQSESFAKCLKCMKGIVRDAINVLAFQSFTVACLASYYSIPEGHHRDL